MLSKIGYYEKILSGNGDKMHSYVDFYSAIDSITDAINLILDTKEHFSSKISKNKIILESYKRNLNDIESCVKEANIHKNSKEIYEKIANLREDIKSIDEAGKSEDDINKNYIRDDGDDIIGKSVGNNRYFKSEDNSKILFTSRNWSEDKNTYSTWYTIPKKGIKSLDVERGKDYYFIVREPDENDRFPYIRINYLNMKKLVEKKTDIYSSYDDYIHFYFMWKKINDRDKNEVKEERSDIHLHEKNIDYELGMAQLKGKNLYKQSKRK